MDLERYKGHQSFDLHTYITLREKCEITRQPQRRLNRHTKEVVKTNVLKRVYVRISTLSLVVSG